MNAVNVVLIVLLALLAGWAVWRAARRARKGGGCCGERDAAVRRVGVKDRNKSHYPYETQLSIGGMTCENCARRVENALNALPDAWATVDISAKTARVRSKTPIDEASLRDAVQAAGYVVLDR